MLQTPKMTDSECHQSSGMGGEKRKRVSGDVAQQPEKQDDSQDGPNNRRTEEPRAKPPGEQKGHGKKRQRIHAPSAFRMPVKQEVQTARSPAPRTIQTGQGMERTGRHQPTDSWVTPKQDYQPCQHSQNEKMAHAPGNDVFKHGICVPEQWPATFREEE